jgi:hypothetical protein
LPGCTSPRRVAIGDVTGDGIQDFVITCMNSETVLLFLGNKDGGYQVSPLKVPDGKTDRAVAERGVTIADLTRDGRNDIIFTNGFAGTITLLIPQ